MGVQDWSDGNGSHSWAWRYSHGCSSMYGLSPM